MQREKSVFGGKCHNCAKLSLACFLRVIYNKLVKINNQVALKKEKRYTMSATKRALLAKVEEFKKEFDACTEIINNIISSGTL